MPPNILSLSFQVCYHWTNKVLLNLFIVKPWSMSRPLSQSQYTPKLNKSPQKEQYEKFGPWADTKIT